MQPTAHPGHTPRFTLQPQEGLSLLCPHRVSPFDGLYVLGASANGSLTLIMGTLPLDLLRNLWACSLSALVSRLHTAGSSSHCRVLLRGKVTALTLGFFSRCKQALLGAHDFRYLKIIVQANRYYLSVL